ncbi:uncharacterized protein NECHADRAFT_70580 [Fusarium vanettenii 77-13-4]|uniref:Enoyl reductase (ER) domain-containing protein n=1 Tax=Fusarium vanettenii (strain ATCC MYA-4622 / CBS 123669 / FGSC 9596 / NRRL 45880 / 77-13-4) TaxID=660122 RepID=C7ZAN4_FUSV7|nr:uncharacterized protein NECHADRAFT_70580 [Fusarium vanettenii 77-13-4]EEU39708.1 hypothetical protein NECHADRAFT_70580 [Fusarium vanettenii 77-13-4]
MATPAPTQSQTWTLREKPYGEPILHGNNPTFVLKTVKIPPLKDGQVLLKTLYLSNDPAQRSWISPLAQPERLYLPPVQVGESMKSLGIATVVESRSPDIPEGSLVIGSPGWTEYSIDDASNVSVIETQPGLPVTHFLGSLGLPGLTAYYALTQIVKATPSDAIVASGAAGAVGTMVVQIAKKMIGCRKVIGLAGTDAKCRWVENLGADVCLNYKSPSFKQDLTKETEGFVEIYFDNVGGDILDFMLTRLAKFGRVAIMRLQILGFINIDWIDHLSEVRQILVDEWKKGNLIVNDKSEMIVEVDFKDIPNTWMMLFSGGNTGKLVTKLRQ